MPKVNFFDETDDEVSQHNVKSDLDGVGGTVKVQKTPRSHDRQVYGGEQNSKKFKTSKHKTPSRRI